MCIFIWLIKLCCFQSWIFIHKERGKKLKFKGFFLEDIFLCGDCLGNFDSEEVKGTAGKMMMQKKSDAHARKASRWGESIWGKFNDISILKILHIVKVCQVFSAPSQMIFAEIFGRKICMILRDFIFCFLLQLKCWRISTKKFV